MSEKNPITIAITGAAGQIGYALLFRLASGSVFGQDQPVRLQLIELEAALPALEGVVMELEDCAFPTLDSVVITSDLATGFRNANWVLLVGSVPRKAGMERKDLLEINGKIFTAQGKAIEANAAPNVRILVVGNPCNTNALIARANAPTIPNDRWFAMTRLDENRAKSLVAKKANVQVGEVKKLAIWGNHSSTQYPDLYHAEIHGQRAVDVIQDDAWVQGDFLETVQQRGAAIIKARGASSAASAANAVLDTVRDLHYPKLADDWQSVAVVSDGQYGVEPGLIFGYPVVATSFGYEVVLGLEHEAFSQGRIQLTMAELIEERDAVKALGLI